MNSVSPKAPLDYDACSEQQLVTLARGKNNNAVRLLISRHNQRLFRVSRSIIRDDAEAEDIVQETYVKAFTNLESFRGESALSTWLTRIAINEALGRMRKNKRDQETVHLDAGTDQESSIMNSISSPPTTPEMDVGRTQVRRMLESAVDGLPYPFRVILVLRDIEGLSTMEVARQLSLKAETVKTRLHRARKQLRTTIEKEFTSEFSGLFPFDGARCARLTDAVLVRLSVLAERESQARGKNVP